jgi:hypothetical protein
MNSGLPKQLRNARFRKLCFRGRNQKEDIQGARVAIEGGAAMTSVRHLGTR